MKNLHAQALAKKRWAKTTKEQRRSHMVKMNLASQKARKYGAFKEKLSTP